MIEPSTFGSLACECFHTVTLRTFVVWLASGVDIGADGCLWLNVLCDYILTVTSGFKNLCG